MKTMTTSKIRFTLPVLAMMVLAACSDGQMSKPPPDLSANKPVPVLVNSFTVVDASDAKAKADKTATIESGGSVMVSWDVGGAKKVEITDSKGKKFPNVDGLVGKTQSDPLMADETLTLTAEGSDGVKAQATATVTVHKKEIKISSFSVDAKEINAGEPVKLCWSLSDAKAEVTVMADGKEIYSSKAASETPPVVQPPADAYGQTSDVTVTTVSKAMRFLLKGADTPVAPPADGYATTEAPKTDASEVCPVTQNPTQTTKYTLTVKDGDKVVSQDVTVTVLSAPADIVAFVAQPPQLSGPGEVTLTWRVTPSDATVSIDHGVTTNDKAEGEKTVQVTDTTTFVLTATTKDGKIQTKTVTVTLPTAAERRVVAEVLTPSIFAGETAKIAITHGNASGKVTLLDGSGRSTVVSPNAGVVSISNPPTGDNFYTIDIDGERSTQVKVEVRGLKVQRRGGWSGVALSSSGAVVAGNIADKSNDVAMVRMIGLETDAIPVSLSFLGKDKKTMLPYGDKYEDMTNIHVEFLDMFGPYNIHSMVFDSKTGRAYAGMTGGILYSDNQGGAWKFVDVIPMMDGSKLFRDAPESHKGCNGIQRTGIKDLSDPAVVNVVDVCDLQVLYVAGKDRLLIATDFFGVVYIDGVDGRIADVNDASHAIQGFKKADNVLFGKAVSKLAVAKSGDQTVLVAAASDGVYVNAKNGDPKAWQQIDKAGLKDSVNTVVVSGSTIYAGTDKGMFKSNGMDASSTFTQVSALIAVGCAAPDAKGDIQCAPQPVIKALAVDAADSATIYVGTAKGLKISRDCAGSFTDVAVDVGEVRNIATSADSGRSAVVLTSKSGLFTSVGVAGSTGTCAASTASQRPTTGGGTTVTGQRPSQPTGPGTVVPK